MENQDQLKIAFRTNYMIWFTMLATVFVYLAILYYLITTGGINPKNPASIQFFKTILSFIALGTFIMIFIIKKIQLNQGKKQSFSVKKRVQQFNVSNIIAWALSESIAIYGLVIGFSSRNINDFFPFMGLAILSLMIHMPKFSKLEEYTQFHQHTEVISPS